ncbi:hypothetical protein [Lacisediminimonas profundi]|uniref:hypothetical protein n=1 Tax=Lacisediminimonas profundi TaxID=2603856 RepID=UPI00124B2CC1|nr:hypothetical protein [Lacisediminimonas profundi]
MKNAKSVIALLAVSVALAGMTGCQKREEGGAGASSSGKSGTSGATASGSESRAIGKAGGSSGAK